MQINSDIYNRFSSHHSRTHINKVNDKAANDKTKKKNINIPVVISSATGTLIPLAIIAKKQNTSLLKVELHELKHILPIGIGSVLGGLTGGIATDKDKDHWKKIKEANYQIITNIVTPMIIVSNLLKVAEKAKKYKALAKCLAVAAGLSTGITLGTFISDIVNNKIIKKGENYKRQVNPKDFIVHVDDISAALAFLKIPFVDKIIPFCFTAAGYEVGSKE